MIRRYSCEIRARRKFIIWMCASRRLGRFRPAVGELTTENCQDRHPIDRPPSAAPRDRLPIRARWLRARRRQSSVNIPTTSPHPQKEKLRGKPKAASSEIPRVQPAATPIAGEVHYLSATTMEWRTEPDM